MVNTVLGDVGMTVSSGHAQVRATGSVPGALVFCIPCLALCLYFFQEPIDRLTYQLSPLCQALCLAVREKTHWF